MRFEVRLDIFNALDRTQFTGVNATAITFTHKGRQYVSIASGMGGGLARRAVGGKVPTGGSLWTFALLPE